MAGTNSLKRFLKKNSWYRETWGYFKKRNGVITFPWRLRFYYHKSSTRYMIGGSTALPFDVVKKFQVGRKRPNRRPAQNDLKIARNTYLDLKCWSRSHYLNAYNQEHAWAPAGTLQLSLLLVLIPSAARIYQWFAWEAFSKFPTYHLDLIVY